MGKLIVSCLQDVLNVKGKQPRVHLSLGLFFLSNYYYRYSDSQQLSVRAEDLLREAYTIDSSDSSVVGLLAELLFKKKDYSEAMKYIEKSIVLYEINGISPSEYIQMKEKILNNSE